MAFEKFTDTSPMPFGEHKGRLLGNVPAKYLLFIYENKRAGRITDYIKENLDALKIETKKKK